MDLVLIPGFWLDGESWSEVTPTLEEAGHRVHPLTLPGLESVEADRSGIGLRDHVDAVIRAVDRIGGPVILVGHSGGGAIAHAVVDARPERIARVVYVDSGPLADGGVINAELPVVDGEIPLPDWPVFDEADLVDLDDDLRARPFPGAGGSATGQGGYRPPGAHRPSPLPGAGDGDRLRVHIGHAPPLDGPG